MFYTFINNQLKQKNYAKTKNKRLQPHIKKQSQNPNNHRSSPYRPISLNNRNNPIKTPIT